MASGAFEPVDNPMKRAVYLAGWLNRLCIEIGARAPGSAAERRAGDLLEAEMVESLGSAQRDWFQILGWEPRGAPLLKVGDEELQTYLYSGSPSTPEGGFEGKLVRLDQEGRLFGLMTEGEPGPAAHLAVSPYGRATAGLVRPFGGKPTFGVGQENRSLLEKAAEEGAPVRAFGGARFIPGAWSSNVVGTIPGRSEKELAFCAHYDTKYNSPGASDNTAATIAMFLLARAVAGTKPDLTLTFIATGAEETGCLGAEHYVESRKRAGTSDRLGYCVNFDSLTYGPHLNFNSPSPEFLGFFREVHRDWGQKSEPVYRVNPFPGLDEAPFYRAGAQVVHVNSRGYDEETLPINHRPEDLPATIHPHLVEDSFTFFREAIRRLAGA